MLSFLFIINGLMIARDKSRRRVEIQREKEFSSSSNSFDKNQRKLHRSSSILACQYPIEISEKLFSERKTHTHRVLSVVNHLSSTYRTDERKRNIHWLFWSFNEE